MASHQHVLPPKDSWKAPQNEGKETKDNYTNGVGQEKWGAGFNVADGIVTYFRTQDPHTYYFSTAAGMTLTYKNMIYTLIDAVEYAFNLWRPSLGFSKIKINGPVAVGSKGCLGSNGADFEKIFMSYPGHASIKGKNYLKWREAVGKGVNKCLKKYIDGVTVTGAPWYPAFAVFPGPVAPPMPNVTWPLIACPSNGIADITVMTKLKKAMLNEFDSGLAEKCHDDIHESVFEAIATCLSVGFLIWVSTQMVNLVMGTGQIPSFAPPVVPGGPVVNGQNIPAPGNLL